MGHGTKGELLAVLAAIKHWHCYLGDVPFELVTDHKALEWLFLSKELPAMLARWVMRLGEYDMTVVHRPGVENAGPDFLSRYPPQGELVAAVVDIQHAQNPTMAREGAVLAALIVVADSMARVGAVFSILAGTNDPWEDDLLLQFLRSGVAALEGVSHAVRDKVQHRARRYQMRPTASGEQLLYLVPGGLP